MSLEQELARAINKEGLDSDLGMPDFIISGYMMECLEALKKANRRAHRWHTYPPKSPVETITKELSEKPFPHYENNRNKR